MPKDQYRFNPDTISFEKVDDNHKKKMMSVVVIFATAATVGLLFFLFLSLFTDSPKERMLKMENETLKINYKQLENKVNNISKVVEDIEKRDDNLYRFLLNSDPLPSELRNSGIGGVSRYEAYDDLSNSTIAKKIARKVDNLLKRTYIQTKSLDELDSLAQQRDLMLSSVPAIIPIRRDLLRSPPSGFRMRFHPILKRKRMHWGIDFSLPPGSEIYATGDGTVVRANRGRAYGIHVVIKHKYGGYETLYAHMKKAAVRPGKKVKRGEVIGYVGSTGMSTGPHLHYEVHKNGKRLNPVNYYFNDLSPQEYIEFIHDVNSNTQTFD